MTIRSKETYVGFRFYDDKTFESVLPVRGHTFYDDFDTADFAPGAISARWAKTITKTAGTPTVGAATNYAGGAVACALDATSEAQEAALHFGNQLGFDGSKALNYEALVQLPVLPGAGAQVVIGMGTAWIAGGPDNQAAYIRFGLRGNGTLLCEAYDGTNRFSVSSGITVATTTEKHHLFVSADNAAGLVFTVDGNVVAGSSVISFGATGAAAQMQPYASVFKTTGTELATLELDAVRIWGNRV